MEIHGSEPPEKKTTLDDADTCSSSSFFVLSLINKDSLIDEPGIAKIFRSRSYLPVFVVVSCVNINFYWLYCFVKDCLQDGTF